MAGERRYTALLVGLGLREFSVAPGELLEIKNAIRKLTITDARSVAEVEALLAHPE